MPGIVAGALLIYLNLHQIVDSETPIRAEKFADILQAGLALPLWKSPRRAESRYSMPFRPTFRFRRSMWSMPKERPYSNSRAATANTDEASGRITVKRTIKVAERWAESHHLVCLRHAKKRCRRRGDPAAHRGCRAVADLPAHQRFG